MFFEARITDDTRKQLSICGKFEENDGKRFFRITSISAQEITHVSDGISAGASVEFDAITKNGKTIRKGDLLSHDVFRGLLGKPKTSDEIVNIRSKTNMISDFFNWLVSKKQNK